MIQKESNIISWIPALILCCVLIPLNLPWNTVYIEFAMPCVGMFAAWLALCNFLFYEPQSRSTQRGIIYLLLTLIYNPVTASLSLAVFAASKNHFYLIVLNLICAAVFLGLWWQAKHRKHS